MYLWENKTGRKLAATFVGVLGALSLVWLATSGTSSTTPSNKLVELQNEEKMLLSGINYHQTQANALSIRLGKVRAAVSGLSQLDEYSTGTHSVAPVGKTQSQ